MTQQVTTDTPAPDVYKVIGAPGTGKTTRVVGNPELPEETSLVMENMEDYSFEDQMIVTYTNAGTDEAADRLSSILDEPKYMIEDRVTTIHGQCFRLLGIEYENVVRNWHKKKFCDRYGLEFGWDDDEDDIMAADKAAGNAFFDIFGWLQSNREPVSNWEVCPGEWTGDRDFEWVAERWVDYKDQWDLIGFGDMIENVVNWGRQVVDDEGLGPLFADEEVSDTEAFNMARLDTYRDLAALRGRGPFVDTKVLYVDEVQDLTPLQWDWYLLQKLVCEKVYIGGDDDQCLPPEQEVTVRDFSGKTEQKPIEDVEQGESVRTSLGNGEYGFRRVEKVLEKKAEGKRFRTFTTESGNEVKVTDNHKMFARIPLADFERFTQSHYVYLMRDDKGRWRIGETDNLRQRLNIERNARSIIPLETFRTRDEALLAEAEYSMKYSIPTISFTNRQGEVLSKERMKDELYSRVNLQIDQIENDFGVDLSKPPLFKKATTRGRTRALNINLKKCADARGDRMRHQIEIHTSDEDRIEELRKVDELSETDGNKESRRFRFSSTDYTEVGDVAEVCRAATDGDIITSISPTQERGRSTVVPAGNVSEGMLLPVEDNGEVVYEEVIDIEDSIESSKVYDLTVADTHNFSSGGVYLSNTIYGWAGANPNFMLDEEGEFEVLDKTYRIPSTIWDTCDAVVRQLDKRQPKAVTPDGDGGDVTTLEDPSARTILQYLDSDDVFILFRARYMINEFTEKLHYHGIPYENMSTFETWNDDIVILRDALAKIANGSESISGYEYEKMVECADDEIINTDNQISKTDEVLGNIGGVSMETVHNTFTQRSGSFSGRITPSGFLDHCNEVNYYQQQAIVGNIENGFEERVPSQVRIGTIHSSKGKEAETVILALDSTKTIMANMRGQTMDMEGKTISDAERRVYYVGMTRASEQLVLAEGLVDNETSIRLSDLLAEYDEKNSQSELSPNKTAGW